MNVEQLLERVAQHHGNAAVNVDEPSRRHFIKLSLGSGFALAIAPFATSVLAQAPEAKKNEGLKPNQMPQAFVSVGKDGTVTVQSNRLDMG